MYKIVPKKKKKIPKNVAGLSQTGVNSFTTPSAASFFGNRGEREALAQLAIELKTK